MRLVALRWVLVLVVLSAGGGARALRRSADEHHPRPAIHTAQYSLLHADLDSDGQVDAVMLTNHLQYSQLEVFLGTHETLSFVLAPEVAAQSTVVAADIDNDGDLDLMVQSRWLPYDVRIWLGDGAGGFKRLPAQEHGRFGRDWRVDHFASPSGSSTPYTLIPQHESPSALVYRTPSSAVERQHRVVASLACESILALCLQHPSDRGPPPRVL